MAAARLLLLLLLPLLQPPLAVEARRQVRWFASDVAETLQMAKAHPRSLSGLYPGFSAAGMLFSQMLVLSFCCTPLSI